MDSAEEADRFRQLELNAEPAKSRRLDRGNLRAHNRKLDDELVAEANTRLETEQDPVERSRLVKQLAELDAIKARTEAPC